MSRSLPTNSPLFFLDSSRGISDPLRWSSWWSTRRRGSGTRARVTGQRRSACPPWRRSWARRRRSWSGAATRPPGCRRRVCPHRRCPWIGWTSNSSRFEGGTSSSNRRTRWEKQEWKWFSFVARSRDDLSILFEFRRRNFYLSLRLFHRSGF